jgi:hypothetical protein
MAGQIIQVDGGEISCGPEEGISDFPQQKNGALARLERAAHGLGMDPAQDFQGLHKKTNTW